MFTLFALSILLRLFSEMPKKSPKDFIQRARENDSDTSNAIVNGTAVKKLLEPKIERNYAWALGLWKGQVYSLGPLSFP